MELMQIKMIGQHLLFQISVLCLAIQITKCLAMQFIIDQLLQKQLRLNI